MGLLGLFGKGGKIEPAEALQNEPDFLKKIETQQAGYEKKEEVEPELALWLCNGTTVKNLKELASALRKMAVKDYKEHVSPERNDIAEWVQEILNNDDLARQLRRAKGKLQAAGYTEKEMKRIKAERKTAQKQKAEIVLEAAPAEQELTIKKPEAEEDHPLELPELAIEAPKEEKAAAEFDSIAPVEDAKPKTRNLFFFGRKKPETQVAADDSQSSTWEPKEADIMQLDTDLQEADPEPQPEELKAEPQELFAKEGAQEEEEAPEDEEEEPELPTGLGKREAELERLERQLNREEDELNSKRLELTARRYSLVKEKGEIEKRKFEEFMRKHKATAQPQMLQGEEAWAKPERQLRGMPDFRLAGAYGKERLQSLLEEAKHHITENNVEKAQKALDEVQSVLGTVYMKSSEKKQIEYEILEVEADLKLASLK